MGAYRLRRESDAGDSDELLPHPEPEVPAREAREDEIPGGARQLGKWAAAAGWSVDFRYARGSIRSGKRKFRVVDSVAVRLAHPATGHQAVAVWVNGSADAAWIRLAGGPWFPSEVSHVKAAIK